GQLDRRRGLGKRLGLLRQAHRPVVGLLLVRRQLVELGRNRQVFGFPRGRGEKLIAVLLIELLELLHAPLDRQVIDIVPGLLLHGLCGVILLVRLVRGLLHVLHGQVQIRGLVLLVLGQFLVLLLIGLGKLLRLLAGVVLVGFAELLLQVLLLLLGVLQRVDRR